MKDRSERQTQKGGQTHAEGQHGTKTREALLQELNANGQRTGDAEQEHQEAVAHREGKHKIHEDREQHDEAEKNSEKNRLTRDGGMDRDTPVGERQH
ncbi:MAG TPA: hypothetical protein VFJ74_02050 [Gemmatimonadaceae bacterium]|nr:hypothetical protein [Gemmatimonadaceae bacterium]